ncbi:MAG: prephenate dehydrogenase/arogenate dehydrogenase family protein [Gammaproteobacteria bacterium]
MLFEYVVIIGVGLIGGSLARALRRAGACARITGVGRHEANLKRALELGVIDDYQLDTADAVKDADLIVLATPLSTTESLLQGLQNSLKPDAIITDVGSAKGSVVNAARASLGERFGRFVPAHPIAGTEQSGVDASFAELFDDHLVILTPVKETDEQAIAAITQMWEECGARVVNMDVDQHDRILAATSHLPHMLAYALVDCLAEMEEREEIFRFAAGGFRDFTRIASSSPLMWHDVCLANRDSLLTVLDDFQEHLARVRAAVAGNDGARLLEIFNRARQARDDFIRRRGGQAALDTDE